MRLWEDLWHLIELLETQEQTSASSTETHITQVYERVPYATGTVDVTGLGVFLDPRTGEELFEIQFPVYGGDVIWLV